ncbi:uncharacterized protein [Solanum lycopersicum]|uniref:uncharacterized protein n=1 Tax=Solanum lycopersicum TaxID=4081 RepID=UPI0002BCA320|nr:uncharacterized protein LOC101244203 [Solanum lycopersicum]
MNGILESPVEALAFNYWSFDVVWTWIAAVVTAAITFWKIKSSSSTLPTPEPALLTLASSQVELMRLSTERTCSTPASAVMLFDDAFLVKEEGTKGKVTVYFNPEDEDECNGDDQELGEEDKNDGVEWFENWEKLLKLRKGERGWYCYQDMKLINGSIVRLWDGSKNSYYLC